MSKHDDSMSIRGVVRAVTCLDDVLRIYEVDPAKRLCIIAHYQAELIDRELNLPESAAASSNGRDSAPGSGAALTDKGREKLPEVARVLERL
jgi:hypothetical protein